MSKSNNKIKCVVLIFFVLKIEIATTINSHIVKKLVAPTEILNIFAKGMSANNKIVLFASGANTANKANTKKALYGRIDHYRRRPQ